MVLEILGLFASFFKCKKHNMLSLRYNFLVILITSNKIMHSYFGVHELFIASAGNFLGGESRKRSEPPKL